VRAVCAAWGGMGGFSWGLFVLHGAVWLEVRRRRRQQRQMGERLNILYCGNDKVEDGIVISVLSLLKNIGEPLHIYILTMELIVGKKVYSPVSEHFASYLDRMVKKISREHCVRFIDISELFKSELPAANLDTRFTPYCMLRLFADRIPEMPDKVLYLDTDVVCRKDCSELYHQDITDCELAGVLDYYGRWFFRRDIWRLDYLNSGVLLMNLDLIRQTGLLKRCRELCARKKMFMPDQSAINKEAFRKKLLPRCYNEQRKLREDTVLQHFSTTFRFFPLFRIQTVKPWQIDQVHDKLKLHEYDDLLQEYMRLLPEIRRFT